MIIDPKDYHIVITDGEEQYRYVTDQQVLEAHGREKFEIFQKYMEGQTCPVFPTGKGDENYAGCYAWDYEKWVGHACPERDKSSSWD